MKLISMTDFVLEQRADIRIPAEESFWYCEHYANFLKQSLTLGMFVPTDEDGKVLEVPDLFDNNGFPYDKKMSQETVHKIISEYQKAKERILFEGFESIREGENTIVVVGEYRVWITWNDSKNVESLLNHSGLDITLTPTVLKQIGI